MIYSVRLAKEATKQLERIPQDRQELIKKHLREMTEDPFRGDVLPLKGKEWQGRYRKRSGRYRIIFSVDHENHLVNVSMILLRNESTYR